MVAVLFLPKTVDGERLLRFPLLNDKYKNIFVSVIINTPQIARAVSFSLNIIYLRAINNENIIAIHLILYSIGCSIRSE
ncbi:MAG: hypothetical protein Q8940_19590 [Bacteroidota bacterium]|nr:hypothetical protein [Bacteroidota bacterium]